MHSKLAIAAWQITPDHSNIDGNTAKAGYGAFLPQPLHGKFYFT